VAIDPCAAYARAVRQTLPQATIVVDHFHLDRLANDTPPETADRRRDPQQRLGLPATARLHHTRQGQARHTVAGGRRHTDRSSTESGSASCQIGGDYQRGRGSR